LANALSDLFGAKADCELSEEPRVCNLHFHSFSTTSRRKLHIFARLNEATEWGIDRSI
jgi:hypothetical protein